MLKFIPKDGDSRDKLCNISTKAYNCNDRKKKHFKNILDPELVVDHFRN